MHKPRVGGTITRKPKAKQVTTKPSAPSPRWGANGKPYLGGKKKEETAVPVAAPSLDQVPIIDPYQLPVVNDDELTVFDIDEPKEEGETKTAWKAKRDKKKAEAEQPAVEAE